MEPDIRAQHQIEPEDVLRLNFIRSPNRFVFRRHYRQGLRSHVMEILDPQDVQSENTGILRDGHLWFPRAIPLKVLRIFRARFSSLTEALEDIERFKRIQTYLTAEYIAVSEEFVADYSVGGTHRVILCGLQTFVDGQIVDPWALAENELANAASQTFRAKPHGLSPKDWVRQVRQHAARFVDGLRRMILETRLIPDLAGIGNLLLTPAGALVLVDINNVCRVCFQATPALDEKGYPTCDKSIEALSRIETFLLNAPVSASDPIYGYFLTPERIAAVNDMHRAFYHAI